MAQKQIEAQPVSSGAAYPFCNVLFFQCCVPRSGGFDCLVSAKTGEGFNELKDVLADAFKVCENNDYTYLVRDRHISLFNSSLENLRNALLKIKNVEGLELVAEDLRLARKSLDDVVGVKTSDSLLGDIFSNFCIGK